MTQWLPGMRVTADRLNEVGPWLDVTFNSWAQGTLGYAPLRVQQYGNRARLDGHAQPTATFTGSQTAFTLPAGLAPAFQVYRSGVRITSGTPTMLGVVINTNGTVTVFSSTSIGATDRFHFTGIDWPLD